MTAAEPRRREGRPDAVRAYQTQELVERRQGRLSKHPSVEYGRAVSTPPLEQIRSEYEAIRPTYVAFAEGLRPLLTQLCDAENLPIDAVAARVKDTHSLAAKFARKGKTYRGLEEITDKCGLRIIARYESTVQPVLDLLAREFEIVESVHHRGAAPEVFGYQSEHVLIRLQAPRSTLPEWRNYDGMVAEVQVRSILQHAWASISHSLDYKSEQQIPAAARRRLFRVAAMLETADEIFDTYREDVEMLRSGYATGLREDEWRKLPIDLESLRATWGKLPVEDVLTTALEAGFDDPGEWLVQTAPTEDWFDFEVGMLIDAAHPAGLRTLGELDSAMRAVADDSATLRKYSELTKRLSIAQLESRGEVEDSKAENVGAIVPDVVVFHLLIQQPTNHPLAEVAYAAVKDHLVDAAIQLGLERQERPEPSIPSRGSDPGV